MKNILKTITVCWIITFSGCVYESSRDDFIKEFYAEHSIGEEHQISFEELVEISKGEDDRSNISEGLKFFQIEDYYKATVTLQFSTRMTNLSLGLLRLQLGTNMF